MGPGRVGSGREYSDFPLKYERTRSAQGPIIQVWPSGQITLTGDVIGSRGGTMRYEATMVFRDPVINLL